MPVKRRVHKRRLSQAAELQAWECLFDTGHDFFDDLPEIGVQTDAYSVPNVSAARQAWHRLGSAFLANRQSDPERQPWALRTFGDPSCQ